MNSTNPTAARLSSRRMQPFPQGHGRSLRVASVLLALLVLLALVVFVFALQMTFPYGRVKEKVIDALSEKYDVTIGDVERGWIPGRLYFNHVLLKTRPGKDETPSGLSIERLEVDLGLLALLRGAASVRH